MYIDLLSNAIVQGCLLSLVCIGYSMAYGYARVINFAHADILILGGGYLVLMLINPSSNIISKLGMSIIFSLACVITFFPWYKNKKSGYFKILLPFFLGLFVFILLFFLN